MAVRTYVCQRCGAELSNWEAFETGWPHRVRYWCLNHIPWWTRIFMRLKGAE